MAFSNYTEEAVLNAIFNNTSFAVATPYLSLHTADPGETGGSEATGGSYARQAGASAFAAASGGSIASDANVTWTGLPAGTFTHVGVYDASTAGNYIARAALSSSVTLPAGSSFTINSGNLTFTLD